MSQYREPMYVILNEVKNLIDSANYKTEILRLAPQNDIATQSARRGKRLHHPPSTLRVLYSFVIYARGL
jgi:hypothetical protein